MFPFTDLFNCSLLMFANSFWNMYSSIRFPSLPMSLLYGISNTVLPTCISNFVLMSDLVLFIYNELILTTSVSSPCDSSSISISTSCTMQFLLLLHTFLKCPILLHAAHVFPYARHCLGAWLSPQYLHSRLWCVAMCASLPQLFFDSVSFLLYHMPWFL